MSSTNSLVSRLITIYNIQTQHQAICVRHRRLCVIISRTRFADLATAAANRRATSKSPDVCAHALRSSVGMESNSSGLQGRTPTSPGKPSYSALLGHDAAMPIQITVPMLRDATGAHDEDELLNTKCLHLEWRDITIIGDALELLSGLRDLYLQHNAITSIEGLEHLKFLQFLALGSNQLTSVRGLERLTSLEVLDVSNNQIEEVEQLPSSIRIFNGYGNPMQTKDSSGYKYRMLQLLPNLIQLDHEDLDGDGGDDDDEANAEPGSSEDDAGSSSAEGKHDAPPSPAGSQRQPNTSVSPRSPFAVDGSASAAAVAAAVAASEDSAAETAAAQAEITDSLERYSARRAEMMARFKGRLEEESARAQVLAQQVVDSTAAELSSARNRLQDMREQIMERSRVRSEATSTSTTAATAATVSAAGQAATPRQAVGGATRDWRSLAKADPQQEGKAPA